MNLTKKFFGAIVLLALLTFSANARIQSSPVGAAAECMDGKYSTSTGRGTCSGHGGVRRWLNRGNSDPAFPPLPPSRRTSPPSNYYPSQPQSTYRTPSYQRPSTTYYPPASRPTPTPKPQPRRVTETITIPSEISARVVGVHDGDTITVLYFERYQLKVRLYGIDAPENSQPFGRASKKKLSDLIFGKNVKLYSKGKDRYGRLLAWVFYGPTCTNKEMVKSGLAWWYRQYAPKEYGLRDVERQARQSKAGLWSGKSPVEPWNWRKR